MISYALLLGHAAPPPISAEAKPRKMIAKEMAGSVADQKDSHAGRIKIAARNRARILDFLRFNGPAGKTMLCDALDLTDDQIEKALETLRKQGFVQLQGQYRASMWAASCRKVPA